MSFRVAKRSLDAEADMSRFYKSLKRDGTILCIMPVDPLRTEWTKWTKWIIKDLWTSGTMREVHLWGRRRWQLPQPPEGPRADPAR